MIHIVSLLILHFHFENETIDCYDFNLRSKRFHIGQINDAPFGCFTSLSTSKPCWLGLAALTL